MWEGSVWYKDCDYGVDYDALNEQPGVQIFLRVCDGNSLADFTNYTSYREGPDFWGPYYWGAATDYYDLSYSTISNYDLGINAVVSNKLI